jgi:hypothetical protein
MQQISIYIIVMGDSPIFLAVLSQTLGPGGHSSFNVCSSALPVCGKTHSIKSDPELRVFLSRMANFCTQHPFLGGTRRVHAQGS